MSMQTRIAIMQTKRENRKASRNHTQAEKEMKKGNIKLITSLLQNPNIIIRDESFSRAKDDSWIKEKQKRYPELKEAMIFVAYSPDEKEEICVIKRIDKAYGPSTEDALFDIDLGKNSPHSKYYIDDKTSKQLFELAYQRDKLKYATRTNKSDLRIDKEINIWLKNLEKRLNK